MLDRLGQQSGVVMKAWGNSTPWSASSARVRGMMAAAEGEWVAPVVSQRWSSVRTKTMFGRSGCGFGPQRSTHAEERVQAAAQRRAVDPAPGRRERCGALRPDGRHHHPARVLGDDDAALVAQ